MFRRRDLSLVHRTSTVQSHALRNESMKSLQISKYLRARTRGQTLAIVGLLLATGVLVGLVAIAFDGASALLQRRVMQNGSEAGALAGINLMGQNLLVSCVPSPCHTAFDLRNSAVYTQVN